MTSRTDMPNASHLASLRKCRALVLRQRMAETGGLLPVSFKMSEWKADFCLVNELILEAARLSHDGRIESGTRVRNWARITLLSSLTSVAFSVTISLVILRTAPTKFPAAVAQLTPLAGAGVNTEGSQNPQSSTSNTGETKTTTTEPSETEGKEPWWATFVGKVAWPLGLITALILIACNDRLRRLFGSGSKLVRKVSAGGVEMEISSEAVDQVRKELRNSFQQLVADARVEYERMTDLQDIDRRLAGVVEQLKTTDELKRSDIRATIHVRDIVFKDFLYQLVDYYPKGGGADRRFSQRYGIIGRSWRSGKSHGFGNVFGMLESEESLVEEWGMTRGETHGILKSKPSCLSVLLRSGGTESGILYIDSSEQNAFGDDNAAQTFADSLEKSSAVTELAAAVERALAPLRAAGPNLDFKDPGR